MLYKSLKFLVLITLLTACSNSNENNSFVAITNAVLVRGHLITKPFIDQILDSHRLPQP